VEEMVRERSAKNLEEHPFVSMHSYSPMRRSQLVPDALRVHKTVGHQGPKIAKSMYQKALLTTMAIRLGTRIGEVVQMRDESGNDCHRGYKPITAHRRLAFFDSTNYSYDQKGLQQLRVTKLKKRIEAGRTH